MIGRASEWVQLCERTCLGDLLNMHKQTEREVGFYRHDQWGFACLADDTRVIAVVFSFGGDHRLGGTVTGTIINKRGGNIELKCTIT